LTFELNCLRSGANCIFGIVFIYKLEPGGKSSGFSLLFLFSISLFDLQQAVLLI